MQRQFFNVVGKLRRKAVFAFLIFFVISSIFTPAGVNLNTLQTELLTAHAALPAGQHCLAAGQDISNLVTDVNDCTQNHNGTIEGGSTGSSSNLQPGELGNCTDPTTSQVTTKVPQSNCSSPKQWVPIAGTTGGNKSDTSGCGLTSGWDLCISDLVYLVAVALPTYFLQIADFLLSLAVNLALQSTTYALSFLSQA